MNIDAHHHFWKYSAAEFDWIDDSMRAIRRNFLPADLAAEIHAAGIDGVVSVQARQSLAETEWLLSLATMHDFVQGVVGWVPLTTPAVRQHCERFSANAKFRAVRHVVQDEPDEQFMLRNDFNRGVRTLAEFDLVYDILIFERQLPQTIAFVDRHPDQVFVLDHVAKPRIRDRAMEPWQTNVRELARRDHVYCKVSGMATEADVAAWTPPQLRPYWEVVLDAFGPRRLMFGSDWPVCLVAGGYRRWYETLRQFSAELSATERVRLFGGTAVEAYRLDAGRMGRP